MLEEREQLQVSRGDSRASDAGSAGTDSGTAGSRLAASGTGSFGARSARKRGLLHRTGITIPAAFLAVLLVVVVWGAAKVMDPQGTGADSLFQAIDGLGSSRSVTMLAQEQQTLIAMTDASKTLTVAAVPAHTDPDQIIAAQNAASSAASSSNEGGGTSVTTMAAPANPTAAQQTAQAMLASFGFSSSQWPCLYSLWERESTWNVYAENTASGAYGIPQALPGYKMASAGADWQTDPATQIRWGLGYIQQVYGTPCGAWAHEESQGFY
jgi:hypothetical protein